MADLMLDNIMAVYKVLFNNWRQASPLIVSDWWTIVWKWPLKASRPTLIEFNSDHYQPSNNSNVTTIPLPDSARDAANSVTLREPVIGAPSWSASYESERKRYSGGLAVNLNLPFEREIWMVPKGSKLSQGSDSFLTAVTRKGEKKHFPRRGTRLQLTTFALLSVKSVAAQLCGQGSSRRENFLRTE
jgi:hypothetical protein